MITDGYDRCRQQKLPSMPNHELKLHPDDSDNDLRRYIQSTGIMVIGAWVRKSRYGDGINFGCCHVSLFSCSHLWISARYKWCRHGFYQLRISVNGRWSFPLHQIPQNFAIELYRSVVGLMCSYDCVYRMTVSFFISLSFFSLILALPGQEVCA